MKRAKTAVLLLISISIFSFILDQSRLFYSMELSLLDGYFVSFAREYPHQDVSLVMIDQNSLVEMNERLKLNWPWPREIYGLLTEYLTANGAEKIVFDVFFDQYEGMNSGMEIGASDASFAKAMSESDNVILAAQLADFTAPQMSLNYSIQTKPLGDVKNKFGLLPISEFFQSAKGIGNAAIPISFDAVTRYTQLFSFVDSVAVPALSVAALPHLNGKIRFADGRIHLDNGKDIPTYENGQYLINWYKKGGVEDGTFPQYSAIRVLEKAINWKRTKTLNEINSLPVKGQTIFIGASALGLSDIKATPFSRFEPFPGVEIHATVFANLKHNDFVINLNSGIKWIVLLLGIALLVYSIIWVDSRWNIPLSISWLVLTAYLSSFLFGEYRIWAPVFELLIVFGITITTSFVVRYITEDRNKIHLKRAFSRYVPKELVNEIIRRPESLQLGGNKKELTVMFSDLAGFTTISEGMEPEELVPYLNEYLSEMTQIVFRNRGTLDKYIGDAIMAFWGAPLDDPHHAYNACNCVIEMQKRMGELQDKWKKSGKPVTLTRFGVNTGNMVVGNVGSNKRFNYTVLGDAVNLAARLEPANKNFGTEVMISESTYHYVKNDFICRELDRLIVKGKSQPVKVFELMADAKDENFLKTHASCLESYKRGLDFYFERNFELAEIEMGKVTKIFPDDGPAKTYLNRIAEFKKNPPPVDWNGVFKLTTK